MKGQLAYKDVHGIVWTIKLVDSFWNAYMPASETPWIAGVTDFYYLIEELDKPTEMVTETPSEPIQIEQADKAAYPDLRDSEHSDNYPGIAE